jgi:protein-disulfide isomerase
MRPNHSRICLSGCLLAIFCAVYAGAQSAKPAKPVVVGSFKGAQISVEDLKKDAAAELEIVEIRHLQADAAYARAKHQALEAALRRIIEGKVLEAEAAARSTTRQALLDKELDGKVKKVTIDDLMAHYPATQIPSDEARQKALARMEPVLKLENYNKAKAEYVAQLKQKYGVTESFEPLRLKMETTGSPAIGPETAPVTVVEFGDYQCATCAAFESGMKNLQKKYGSQVRYVYRNFSLDRVRAEGAAEASLCAGEQGRFWDMHDLFFKTGRAAPENINMQAVALNLNLESFGACMNSGRYTEQVKQDLFAGARLGVMGTPSIFVNGRPLATPHSEADVAKVIEEELRRISRTTPAIPGSIGSGPRPGDAVSVARKEK